MSYNQPPRKYNSISPTGLIDSGIRDVQSGMYDIGNGFNSVGEAELINGVASLDYAREALGASDTSPSFSNMYLGFLDGTEAIIDGVVPMIAESKVDSNSGCFAINQFKLIETWARASSVPIYGSYHSVVDARLSALFMIDIMLKSKSERMDVEGGAKLLDLRYAVRTTTNLTNISYTTAICRARFRNKYR